jgi:hypothetical protein
MWQLVILISIVLLIALLSRFPRQEIKVIQTDKSEMIKCKACNINALKIKSFKKAHNWFCSEECITKNDI